MFDNILSVLRKSCGSIFIHYGVNELKLCPTMSINHLLPNLLFICCISLRLGHGISKFRLLFLFPLWLFALLGYDRVICCRFTFIKIWVVISVCIIFSLFLHYLFHQILEIILVLFLVVRTLSLFLIRLVDLLFQGHVSILII